MAQFSYTGRTAAGALTSGKIDAQDAPAAAKMLISRQVTPLDIVASSKTEQQQTQQVGFFTPKVKLEDLVIFARQMYSLSKSGIPILRAVKGLADTTHSKRLSVALNEVAEQLTRGRTLSAAFNQHPQIFDQLFVGVVHVGENTGHLDAAFLQLSEYLEREQETRKQIKSATRYPSFVLVFLALAFVILNLKVVPVFANMFSKFGAELPLMTRILIGTSAFVQAYWPHMLVLLLGLVVAIRKYVHTPTGRYRWDKHKLRLPLVGSIFERTLLGRFCRSFSMMLRTGVPLTSAMSLVADAVSNSYMADKIVKMRRNVEKGEHLTRVTAGSGLFTPLVLQMINVGEETGRVDEMLAEVAEYYEREVDYDLKSLTSKIEPILIAVVSAMVLVLALGIFTPMWDMMGAHTGT